ncbi:MAG: UTRA domain-containing protein [Geodermatophilaceae bacterium]|nr:UTRA domain-containing protein [Geodermatophilaceae bacterium]
MHAGRGPAPTHVAEAIGEEPGTEIVIRRRQLSDPQTGKSEEIGASYLPVGFAADTFLDNRAVVPKALFLCVEELSGKQYAHAYDQWTATMPTGEEADALDLQTGAPVIDVVHTARAADGTVLEVSESVWPADRIVVIDDYPIEPEAQEPSAPSEVKSR